MSVVALVVADSLRQAGSLSRLCFCDILVLEDGKSVVNVICLEVVVVVLVVLSAVLQAAWLPWQNALT
jgi:hypothetical protein